MPGEAGAETTELLAEFAELLRASQTETIAALREARQAGEAAAMWQERCRNLETEVSRLHELLALPAHQEEPERPGRRWRWPWRR